MEGYIGLELKSKIYGYEPPKEVIFELKYSTDEFKSHKKSSSNPVETYDFSITDDFNRGELEGGFYYMIYDNPEKNKLVVMNRAQIEKRKPEYASAEFWGGEKDNWEYDQAKGKNVKKGTKEVEGWEEEMFLKTLKRHCCGSIDIDSQKIHDHLLKVIENESQSNEREVAETITAGTANRKQIGFEAEDAEYEEAEEEQPDSKEDEDAENQRIMEETLAEEEAKKQPQTVYPGF
jgi:recombination protein RecT